MPCRRHPAGHGCVQLISVFLPGISGFISGCASWGSFDGKNRIFMRDRRILGDYDTDERKAAQHFPTENERRAAGEGAVRTEAGTVGRAWGKRGGYGGLR